MKRMKMNSVWKYSALLTPFLAVSYKASPVVHIYQFKSGNLSLKHALHNHLSFVTSLHFAFLPCSAHTSSITSPNFASTSRLVLFTGSEDKLVKGVDVEDGTVRWSFEGHQGAMYVIFFGSTWFLFACFSTWSFFNISFTVTQFALFCIKLCLC